MALGATARRPVPRKHPPRARGRLVSVVFVCYGNACRSQMAEGWARHYGAGRVAPQSAGVHPLGQVTPETQAVMAEKGVSLEGHYSKGLGAIEWERVDVLVDMAPFPAAGGVAGFHGQEVRWEVTDPFLAPMEVYRSVRDDLEQRVRGLLDDLADPARRTAETL